MQRKAWIAAAAAAALVLACASMAQAATVNDPDDPGVANDLDIALASEGHWGTHVSHTIKTFAPYSRRPCLQISLGTGLDRYMACSTKLHNITRNLNSRITVTETPAGAPDTVTYSFDTSLLGSPVLYHWASTTSYNPGLADRTPWALTVIGPIFPRPVVDEEPIPLFDENDVPIVIGH